MNNPAFAECQACGDKLKELSPLEAQKIADNPYNYVLYCSRCIKDGSWKDLDYDWN